MNRTISSRGSQKTPVQCWELTFASMGTKPAFSEMHQATSSYWWASKSVHLPFFSDVLRYFSIVVLPLGQHSMMPLNALRKNPSRDECGSLKTIINVDLPLLVRRPIRRTRHNERTAHVLRVKAAQWYHTWIQPLLCFSLPVATAHDTTSMSNSNRFKDQLWPSGSRRTTIWIRLPN